MSVDRTGSAIRVHKAVREVGRGLDRAALLRRIPTTEEVTRWARLLTGAERDAGALRFALEEDQLRQETVRALVGDSVP